MSKYTPTTEMVRLAWIDRQDFLAQVHGWERPTDEESGAGFDRWLQSAKAEAWGEGFQDGERQAAEGEDGPRFVNPYRESD